jgi:hypothetical protein
MARLTPFIRSLRFVAFQILLLVAFSPFLRSQSAPPPAPYIVVASPPGEAPETAETGAQVAIYGTGFLPGRPLCGLCLPQCPHIAPRLTG